MLLFLRINVKLLTAVGILSFMSRKNSCSTQLSMKKNITSQLDTVSKPLCLSLFHLLALLAIALISQPTGIILERKMVITIYKQLNCKYNKIKKNNYNRLFQPQNPEYK